MPCCVLRVYGPYEIVAAAVADTELKFKESVFSERRRQSEQDESTFWFEVSDGDGDHVPVQIEEATNFLAAHRAELTRLLSRDGVEGASLDFGWDFPHGIIGQGNCFPIELIRLCAEIGIELDVSVYGVWSERSPRLREPPPAAVEATKDLIDNAERVLAVFGKWPSFHDAEVLRVVLDSSRPEGPTLEAQVHVFQMTEEIDLDGYFVCKHHTLVTLRFTGVALEEIDGLERQNVLMSLDISSLDPSQNEGRRLAVEMPSSYGLCASFKCKRCEVTDVRPYDVPS